MHIATFSIAFSALAFSACAPRSGMVRIPPADATPPQAALVVEGTTQDVGPEGQASLRLAAEDEPQSVSLLETDSLVLTAIAEDGDGGVKKSALEGNAIVTCKDAQTGKTTSKSTAFGRRYEPGTPRISRAQARREEQFVLRGSDFALLCPGGHLQGAFGQASATAANFHGGGSHSARLRFKVNLSEVAANAIPYPVRRSSAQGLASSGTGFSPAAGFGGSEGGVRLQSPIPAGNAASMSGIGSGDESDCIDPPVPFVSPRRTEVSPSGASQAAPASRRGARSAQTTQIPRSRS